MKKSLFLVCCVLLLLLTLAAPALADIEYYVVNPVGGAISAVDQSGGTRTLVETIPAGSEVFCGYSWIALTRGVTAAGFPASIRQRLSVSGPGGAVREPVTEADSQSFWGPLYLWNQRWYDSPEVWWGPYNPKVASGVWARDWFVPCGELDAGEYTITYNDMLVRHVADPLWFPGPSVFWPGGWAETPLEATFSVD